MSASMTTDEGKSTDELHRRKAWDNIPAELRALNQWVVADSDKVPRNPRTGQCVDPTNPETGGTFEEAVQAGRKHIGFILRPDDPFTIVDLDDPYERNFNGVKSRIEKGDPDYQEAVERDNRHTKIYEAFDTYAETSQSGRGVHLVMRGSVPRGVKRDKVEIYSCDRYMIFTGNVLKAAPVSDCQTLLDGMFSQMGKLTDEAGELIEEDPVLEDSQIWDMAKEAANSEKFIDLCDGEWQKYSCYPSQSEADFALLSMLAFYSPSNEQVRRMFRLTKLGERPKATRNNVYIDRSLKRIRAREAPLVDISGILAPAVSKAQECRQSPFPLECLGEPLADMGRAVCASERVPEAIAGCGLLGVLSASLGSGLQVQSESGLITKGNLYLLTSADSGTGKSRAFGPIAKPFLEKERLLVQEWKTNDLPRLRAEKGFVEKEIAVLERKAGNAEGRERQDVLNDLETKRKNLDEIERRLIAPSLHCEDISTEKLAVLLQYNDEQLASFSSDARDVLNNILGRYQNGKGTDESLYLKAFSGEPVRVDRIMRDAVSLSSPCLTVLWLVQPDKLEAILANGSLQEGGFIPRFLLCHSHAQPQKIGGVKVPKVSPEIAGAYYKLIEALLATYRFAKYPATIKATPDAEAALVEHHDALVPRRCAGGDLADVTSYVSRWNEQAWRISVCLHAAKHGANAAGRELELETVQRAIRLADWFASQQLEILSASRKKAKQDLQDRVLALLIDHPQGITARDVCRKRIKRTSEEAGTLLAEMETAGMLAGKDSMPPGGGHVTRFYIPAKK